MVRRRGGGTGQGGKRQATTPVGGVYKDSRRNIQGDEDFDDEEQWTQVVRSKQRSPTQSGSGPGPSQLNQPEPIGQPSEQLPSFASVAGQGLSMQTRRDSVASAMQTKEKKVLERKFRTPDPDGPMRDDIVVEVQTVNDRPFKGSLTFTEAMNGVFETCLGLDKKLVHGVRFAFSTYPVIKYKLKEQIDVDRQLQHVEYFDFVRRYTVKGEERSDRLSCKIRGLRTGNPETNQADPDPNVRWVKLEWLDYSLEETSILDWLNYFGDQAGELTEDIHPNSDSDADPVGNGTFSIKMRLRRDVPQLLPMWGKRVRVYHRGVQKLCSNCFGTHPRRNCRSEKVAWTRYVLNFMEKYPEIPSEMYGRWWKVINDEFGEIIEEGIEQTEENQSAQNPPTEEPERNETSARSHSNKQPNYGQSRERLTKDEENNLADYLNLGMSIREARAAFQTEVEAAELRHKVRENQRAQQRGSIKSTGRNQWGASTSTASRGRGGLSFN